MKNMYKFVFAGAAVAAAIHPWPSFAQSSDAGGGAQLEQILVTARRRVEALQTTPIAVTAVSSETLRQTNFQQITDAAKLVPNLSQAQTTPFVGASISYIRGIGSTDTSLVLDTPVATYVDGVLLPRILAADLTITEPERVEVLRGPQGTLFGRNTTGGAINVTTAKPKDEFGVEQKFGMASFGEWSSRTTLDTGKIGDTGLSAKIAYLHRERGSYVRNPFQPDGAGPGSLNSESGLIRLRGDWGSVRMDYAFDWNELRGRNAAFQITAVSQRVQDYLNQSTRGNKLSVSQNYLDTLGFNQPPQRKRSLGHSFTLEYDINDHLTAKSITGYRRFRYALTPSYNPPGLFGPVGGVVQEIQLNTSPPFRVDDAHSFSEELQLLGSYGNVNFIGGLYYFNEYGKEDAPTRSLVVLSPTSAIYANSRNAYIARSKSYAAFSQVSYKPGFLDEKLELTAGIRYTKDKRFADQTAPIVRIGSKSFNNTSYLLSAAYQISDDMMVYGKYSTGYRSGGFNARASGTQGFLFPAEKVKAGEIGVKSEFLDNRLRVNAALWTTAYNDLQTTIYTNNAQGTSNGFTNPAQAKLKGFEVEVTAVPLPNFTVDGSVGYTEPKYKEIYFPNPVTGIVTNYASIAKFPYVPRWTGHIGAQYLVETDAGDWTTRVDWSAMSKRYIFVTNLPNLNPLNDSITSGGHYTIDARLIWSKIPTGLGKTEASINFYVENVTNQHYRIAGIDFGALGFAGASYNMPRRFGIDFTFKY